MWGSMGGGGVSEGEEGGGGVHHHRPTPPPPKRSPTPPNPSPRNESFLSSRPTKATTGRSPGPKGRNPPPPPPPPHGLRRPSLPPNPPTPPRPPHRHTATPSTVHCMHTPWEALERRNTFHTPQPPSPMSPRVAANLLAELQLVEMDWEQGPSQADTESMPSSHTSSRHTSPASRMSDDASTLSCSTMCSHCTTP